MVIYLVYNSKELLESLILVINSKTNKQINIYEKMDLNVTWISYDIQQVLALVYGVFCEFVTFQLVSWVRCGT